MIDFTLETHIDRPAAEVFAYVTDPDRLATWQTNTVSSVQEGDGPLGLGTRLREVHRGPGGKEFAVASWRCRSSSPAACSRCSVVEGTPVHLRMTFDAARARDAACPSARTARSAALKQLCCSRSSSASSAASSRR